MQKIKIKTCVYTDLKFCISKTRGFLFSLLGPVFSPKCNIGPLLMCHLWKTYSCPVLRSGLSSLVLLPSHLIPLHKFHKKILRSFLRLSDRSPIPALYLLLGECPMDGQLELDALSLFWSIWNHPESKIAEIIFYILTVCQNNSRTWSNYIRKICKKYELPDPLTLLQSDTESKSSWKHKVKRAVVSYHDNILRGNASTNSKMTYLNVSNRSVSGPPHPVLSNVVAANDVIKLRVQVRFLTGDYLTYSLNHSHGNGKSPHCRLCSDGDVSPDETVSHVISQCSALENVRRRVLPEILDTVRSLFPHKWVSNFLHLQNDEIRTQYILDCTSLNLPDSIRVKVTNSSTVFKVTHDFCFAIHKERMRLLNLLKK